MPFVHSRMTSESHPLRIDGINMLGSWGMLGITFCPGKKDARSRSGFWDRDLSTDLDAIRAWGAAAVVTLIEPHEFGLLGVEALGQGVVARDMKWCYLPIRDVSVPDASFEAEWLIARTQLLNILRNGKHVVFHCRGGLGRAGLVAARLLMETGVPCEKAVQCVRAARPGAIETREQENYLRLVHVTPQRTKHRFLAALYSD